MKIRTSFVTNSSSSSFIITNISDKKKTIADLIKENKYLLEDLDEDIHNLFSWYEELTDKVVEWSPESSGIPGHLLQGTVDTLNITFEPHETKEIDCTDHSDEDLIQPLIHNSLAHNGSSKSFKWRFGTSNH